MKPTSLRTGSKPVQLMVAFLREDKDAELSADCAVESARSAIG